VDDNEAWRVFARAQAAAWGALAANLPSKLAEPPRSALDGTAPEPTREHILGTQQAKIVRLPAIAAEEGAKVSEIASATGAAFQNVNSALIGLKNRGIVELVPGQLPRRFRLVARYRVHAE
jgi:predicted Rossmann fold nucleotide-binding protein DprA/Smf involved in DNA uptake